MEYQIFVINLDRNKERLDFMTKRLNELGMPFSRFPAVDGKVYDFRDIYDPSEQPMTPGNLGCALSHRQIYQKIIDEGIEYSLIFEDDVTIQDELPHIIKQELAKRQRGVTSWEYLSFNYTQLGSVLKQRPALIKEILNRKDLPFLHRVIKAIISIIKSLIITPVFVFEKVREILYTFVFRYGKPVPALRPFHFAGCYMITIEGARKMLAVSDKIVYMPDHLQNVARKKTDLALYKFVPPPAFQLGNFGTESATILR